MVTGLPRWTQKTPAAGAEYPASLPAFVGELVGSEAFDLEALDHDVPGPTCHGSLRRQPTMKSLRTW
ncbi:MAG: hypothetical protein IPM79_25355 [Polyangiaceae bacterium]|nr:hypothetical protein [Polyangiaceae bacterium]